MSELSKIEPNKDTVMTETLHRIFNTGGCDPTCHCCNNKIAVGEMFRLASVTEDQAKRGLAIRRDSFRTDKPHDVMLCGNVECSVERMIVNARKYVQLMLNPVRSGGCSIINGKIVP